MIKAIIFDLDDTLCDTSSIVQTAKKKMVDAMIKAGLPSEKKDFIKSSKTIRFSGKEYARQVIESSCIVDTDCTEIMKAGLMTYYGYLEDLKLYPGTKNMLERLKNYRLILLTTGIPETQKNKIEFLGINKYFEDIIYDDINKSNKKKKIKDILKKYNLIPDEVISIGDKNTDIEASNRKGVISVQLLLGRFKDIKPKNKYQDPDYIITKIDEILEIIHQIEMKE